MAIRIDRADLFKRVDEQRKQLPFYRIPALNYRGIAKDHNDDTPLEEDIAEWLYEKITTEEGLAEVDRMLLEHSTMRPERRDFPEGDGPIHSRPVKINNTNRNEENIAKVLFNQGRVSPSNSSTPAIEIIDYQVPVNRVLHSGNGKVDLVIKTGKLVVLCELKDDKSEETFLRAMVEARTYYLKATMAGTVAEAGKQIAHSRFVNCYGENVHYGVAIFENTRPFDSWSKPNLKNLHRLAARWDVPVFLVRRCDRKGDNAPYNERLYSMEEMISRG